jgi:hypothetical protein
MELEIKDMLERQADMARINEKLMKVFENKMNTSKERLSTCKVASSASCKSINSELVSKIDQVLSIEKERIK